jgi:predicted DCC family thiol-disulfide oxidoreductase YuxK
VRVLFALGFPWSWLGAFVWLVPKPLRDTLYDVVAARRARWFGRLERCRLPAPGERERFLDAGERG